MSEKTVGMQGNDVRMVLRDYIERTFPPEPGQRSFSDSDSFLERGIINSTGVLELLGFIEETFKISVEDDEVVPENLDSLEKLDRFINLKARTVGSS